MYPPFSMVDSSGKLTGIEPTWAREMCKRIDADCEFMVMAFKPLILALPEGKFDAPVSQINPLPEPEAKALFSMPIVCNADSHVVPANSHYQFIKEGLNNVKLGEQRGSADLSHILRVFGGSVPIVTLVEIANATTFFDAPRGDELRGFLSQILHRTMRLRNHSHVRNVNRE